ncbi:hypothetical protein GGI12_003947 [Dipsacomyces acuminosporus]|nr:hypothetical protein GGI12_003947 [Dipsacomyces acuminosporus]
MSDHISCRYNAHIYKHLSSEEQQALDDLRERTHLLDDTNAGSLRLTKSQYYLLLPILNVIVIRWHYKSYQQMAGICRLTTRNRNRMICNMLIAAVVGFIPVLNIIWSRRFKCNTTNLTILEGQLRAEENKFLYGCEDVPDCLPLPKHIDRLFSSCPVYQRGFNSMEAGSLELSSASTTTLSSTTGPPLSETPKEKVLMDGRMMDGGDDSDDDNATLDEPHASRLGKDNQPTVDCAVIDVAGPNDAAPKLEQRQDQNQDQPSSSWLYSPVAYISSLIWG